MGMLVLSRQVGQRVVIGADIVVTLVTATKGTARIGFEARPEIRIDREEIRIEKDAELAAAAAVPLERSSGNGSFDGFVQRRFVRDGARVVLLPDPLGGQFSTSMTPEQAEFLIERLTALAREARADRGRRMPLLYPEDAQ